MRIVYFGSGEFGCPSLRKLVESGHELVGVVTQPSRPAGRGKKLQPTPIAVCARELGVEPVECDNVNTVEFLSMIRDQWQVELVVVIAFGQKIGAELLRLEKCRWINLLLIELFFCF